jgi:hypothetical protein
MTTHIEWRDKYAKAMQGLLYALECNLATVEYLAMLKRPSKSELERQINIAQKTLDCIQSCGYDASEHSIRIGDVYQFHNNNVQKWAKAIRKRWTT